MTRELIPRYLRLLDDTLLSTIYQNTKPVALEQLIVLKMVIRYNLIQFELHCIRLFSVVVTKESD